MHFYFQTSAVDNADFTRACGVALILGLYGELFTFGCAGGALAGVEDPQPAQRGRRGGAELCSEALPSQNAHDYRA